jgi:hypothetical protein
MYYHFRSVSSTSSSSLQSSRSDEMRGDKESENRRRSHSSSSDTSMSPGSHDLATRSSRSRSSSAADARSKRKRRLSSDSESDKSGMDTNKPRSRHSSARSDTPDTNKPRSRHSSSGSAGLFSLKAYLEETKALPHSREKKSTKNALMTKKLMRRRPGFVKKSSAINQVLDHSDTEYEQMRAKVSGDSNDNCSEPSDVETVKSVRSRENSGSRHSDSFTSSIPMRLGSSPAKKPYLDCSSDGGGSDPGSSKVRSTSPLVSAESKDVISKRHGKLDLSKISVTISNNAPAQGPSVTKLAAKVSDDLRPEIVKPVQTGGIFAHLQTSKPGSDAKRGPSPTGGIPNEKTVSINKSGVEANSGLSADLNLTSKTKILATSRQAVDSLVCSSLSVAGRPLFEGEFNASKSALAALPGNPLTASRDMTSSLPSALTSSLSPNHMTSLPSACEDHELSDDTSTDLEDEPIEAKFNWSRLASPDDDSHRCVVKECDRNVVNTSLGKLALQNGRQITYKS